jgi:hypothetical protein
LLREADGVVEENLVSSGLDDQGRQAGQVGEYGADEAKSGSAAAESRLRPTALELVSGDKQLPVPLGDDFDGAVAHFDGGLIVNRIRRIWDPGRPSFCLGHGVARHVLVS